MKTKLLLIAASLPLMAANVSAQVLVPWNQQWKYMHPMGILPDRPAGGADTDFNTTWFLSEPDFNMQYDGPTIGSVPRVTAVPGGVSNNTYDSGVGPGPIGYEVIDYFTGGAGEMTAFGKLPTDVSPAVNDPASVLSIPFSSARRVSYYRSTFEVTGTDVLVKPVVRMLMDDGCFIYIDGVQIAAINMPTTSNTDVYATLNAVNATNTETALVSLNLYDAPNPGAATRVINRLTSLAPGTHTIAISARSNSQTSSDMAMGLELSAQVGGIITASASGVTRDTKGTPSILDDEFSFAVTVNQTNVPPPGSWSSDVAASDTTTTGSYAVTTAYGPFPAADSPKTITYTDGADNSVVTSVIVTAPKPEIIVSAGNPAVIPFDAPALLAQSYTRPDDGTEPSWSGGTAAAFVQIQPTPYAGANKYFDINNAKPTFISEGVNVEALSSITASIDLAAYTTSTSTFETGDTLVVTVQTSVTGDFSDAVTAVTLYDTTIGDGVAQFAELKVSDPGINYGTTLLYPETDFPFVNKSAGFARNGAKYARFVAVGGNDSASEHTLLDNLRIGTAQCRLTLASAPTTGVFSNGGDDDPGNDSFPVTFTLNNDEPGRAGYLAPGDPAVHAYGTAATVNVPYSAAAQDVNFVDSSDGGCALAIAYTNPQTTVALSTPVLTRIENAPGAADDTFTFTVEVTGTTVGLHWSADQAVIGGGGINEGLYAVGVPVGFGPFPVTGPVTLIVSDKSRPASQATVTVTPPGRYDLGNTDFGGGLQPFSTSLSTPPAAVWIKDPVLLSISNNTGVNAVDAVVLSEPINLTGVGEVRFTATLNAADTSTGSNYDLVDKFKAELIIDAGLPTEQVVNLVTPYDVGNGLSAVPFVAGLAVPNGPPDEWINGYTGTISAADGFAAAADDYNAHLVRDEFNRNGQLAADPMNADITFTAIILEAASSVQLRITSQGIQGTETATFKDALFALNIVGPGDTDGDGQSDAAEALAGTDPNDSTDFLRVTDIVPDGAGGVNVTFPSKLGIRYQAEISPLLDSGWTPLGPVVDGTGAPLTAPVTPVPVPGETKYFLRLRTVPTP